MRKQSNTLNFEGQNIYVGIDVHLKSWTVSILSAHLHHKTFVQPPSPEALSSYLHAHFPNGNYLSAYEAGFSGFWAHYKLVEMGIQNIVVNPADVSTSQKERLQKTDAVDSRKIARSLRSNELTAIHVPCRETLEVRTLLRSRDALVRDLARMKQRIKAFLYYYGIDYPEEFRHSGTHWSRAFMNWLRNGIRMDTEEGSAGFSLLLDSVESQRRLLLEATRKLRALSRSDRYATDYGLLRSVPGIGMITALAFLAELEDIRRFANSDRLAGYIGLVPTSHSTGEKDNKGEMTFRGQMQLRSKLIECAWFAARLDPALNMAFSKLTRRMEPNKAIVRIARKLLNRIFYVLKYKRRYKNETVE
ncbi:IS110 family transposase [Bacteroides sp. An19]|uniref:IS110 family transposase n=1 Tax=Bacteroides sp. An19 TaxID=1965580 RepID=UPI000B3697BA|nr:IS110 family transposase [Bacteroides sp. An19]OUP26056.1 IS110 family transposase [Bacteroides sp. An19]